MEPRQPQLTPSAVGGVPIYVAGSGDFELNEAGPDGEIYAVARLNPAQAMEAGLDAVREFMRAVGSRMGEIAEAARPDEVTLAFSISFDAKGGTVIPLLVTGEAGLSTGLSVNAVWRRSPAREAQEPGEPR
jgi:hypothetical protein